MPKKIIIIAIQCIFLICPVLWLIFAVNYKSVAAVLKSLNFSTILFLVILLIVRFALQSFRFWLLITPFSKKIKPLEFITLDWKARYYSIIMPSSAGQDITRAVLLKNHLSAGEILAISVFFRITGMITFISISLFGFFRLYSQQNISAMYITAAIAFLAVCAASVVLFSEKVTKKVLSLLPQKTPKKVIEFLSGVSQAILSYKNFPKLVTFNFFFSLVLHLMFLVFPVISIYAICGELKIIDVLTFIPPIEIFASVIPFAPNGAGIREGLIIMFFNVINQTKEHAFSYITLNIMNYLIPFLGAFVVIFDKLKKKS